MSYSWEWMKCYKEKWTFQTTFGCQVSLMTEFFHNEEL